MKKIFKSKLLIPITIGVIIIVIAVIVYFSYKGDKFEKLAGGLKNYDDLSYDQQVALVINALKHSDKYDKQVRDQAQENNMSYQERLKYEAEWQLDRHDIKYLLNTKIV